MGSEIDKYQQRYLDHQARKKIALSPKSGDSTWEIHTNAERDIFFKLLADRRSQRIFITREIEQDKIIQLAEAMAKCPSSCNRQAISARLISDRDGKELLSGLLVGGVSWAHRANRIVLLYADMDAYKSPSERDFMPYLDAGVMVMTIYLACESMNIGAAYVSPNIREANQQFFETRFGGNNLLFCGAMALGYYDLRTEQNPKRPADEVWIK